MKKRILVTIVGVSTILGLMTGCGSTSTATTGDTQTTAEATTSDTQTISADEADDSALVYPNYVIDVDESSFVYCCDDEDNRAIIGAYDTDGNLIFLYDYSSMSAPDEDSIHQTGYSYVFSYNGIDTYKIVDCNETCIIGLTENMDTIAYIHLNPDKRPIYNIAWYIANTASQGDPYSLDRYEDYIGEPYSEEEYNRLTLFANEASHIATRDTFDFDTDTYDKNFENEIVKAFLAGNYDDDTVTVEGYGVVDRYDPNNKGNVHYVE